MKDTRSDFGWPALWLMLLCYSAGMMGGCQATSSDWAGEYLSAVPEDRRLIEVPLDRLRAGDMRLNIAIRAGDELLFLSERQHDSFAARRVHESARTGPLPPSHILSDEHRGARPAYSPPFAVGDIITLAVYELIEPGVDHIQTLQVDEAGQIQVDVLGPFTAEGHDWYELQSDLRDTLEDQGILRNATISVIPQTLRHNTFTLLLDDGSRHELSIPKPGLRMLEAIKLAEIDLESGAHTAYIIRRE